MPATFRCLDSERIAPDTWVVRRLYGEGANPVAVFVNSLVITGTEPVIVDTGASVLRDEWIRDVSAIVDPADVRWIFISHDDVDHTGNLVEFLELCPQATLVTNWFSVERLASAFSLPLARMRWLNPGERFRAGDRELVAVVPPTFDSPTTRGLFDTRSGVYWASDSFSTPVTHEVSDIDELDPGFWREGFLQMQRVLSPWHQWLDAERYGRHLRQVGALEAAVVATAHGPALRGAQIASAFSLLSELPHLPVAPLPGQADLDAAVAAMTLAADPPTLAPSSAAG
ncbi:MAG TPA: MBL fold metallo-hydrolase [Acidimicrobiales bacterium]|nr:MBL fold metallo-hydrolase [Acidimicrobiales bacterium]